MGRVIMNWRRALDKLAAGGGNVTDARLVVWAIRHGPGIATPTWLAERYPEITERDLKEYRGIALMYKEAERCRGQIAWW